MLFDLTEPMQKKPTKSPHHKPKTDTPSPPQALKKYYFI